MRRIILLMTVGAAVVVGTLLAVSVAGAHKHPTAMAQKHPTKTVLIQNFSFKPAHITIKRGTRRSDGSTRTPLPTPQRPTTEDRLTPDDWVKDRAIHTPSRERARSPTTARYIPI
jgi:hypothetical protein